MLKLFFLLLGGQRRGPGRPRTKPIGPLNQALVRGRRPGRPPLSSRTLKTGTHPHFQPPNGTTSTNNNDEDPTIPNCGGVKANDVGDDVGDDLGEVGVDVGDLNLNMGLSLNLSLDLNMSLDLS